MLPKIDPMLIVIVSVKRCHCVVLLELIRQPNHTIQRDIGHDLNVGRVNAPIFVYCAYLESFFKHIRRQNIRVALSILKIPSVRCKVNVSIRCESNHATSNLSITYAQ